MEGKNTETQVFEKSAIDHQLIRNILEQTYQALEEKGYDPLDQIIGYILSGDPTYITSHKMARNKMQELERDELLGEILKYYLSKGFR
ncbi:IreB family regulatory phosphoprotein [Peptoniphilus sp. GNH]|nr:hypothetical protein HMPREF3189_00176 [Clostridiales bacterium KA00134]UHR03139.1 IreB family regulatory phosphoprotein [Peptoniphilus sp. GNH]